jgi:hypothetical protein
VHVTRGACHKRLQRFYVLHSDLTLWLSASSVCPFMTHGFWLKLSWIARIELLWDHISKVSLLFLWPPFWEDAFLSNVPFGNSCVFTFSIQASCFCRDMHSPCFTAALFRACFLLAPLMRTAALLNVVPLGTVIFGENTQDHSAISGISPTKF